MIKPLATAVPEEETHRNFYEIIFDFWAEFFDFLRYIFYGIFIGEKP